MRAAVLRDGRVEVRETADPVPGPGQLLARTLSCAICASDLHFMDHPEGVAADDSGLWDYHADRDIVMGHEFVGEIVSYGPGTEGRLPVGTRVTSLPVLVGAGPVRIIGCSPEAPGGFGELMLLTESLVRAVPEHVPSDQAALADAFAVGEYYVRRAALGPRDVPLVIGAGAIGLSAVAALRRRGVGPILVADYNTSRLETAKALGATHTISPADRSPYDLWREVALEGRSGRPAFGAADPEAPQCVVFEFVGLPGVLDGIIQGCERGTRILSAGGPPEGDRISSMVAKRKGVNIQFGGGPDPEDWYGTLEAICAGGLDVSPVIGLTVDLDGVPDALQVARRADGPARIMIHPAGDADLGGTR
ncbi:alcohol dehydrogenase catalytic domain-containing protein [Frankia sp. CNm7]|uniref:Alcohol dehydrogenase catalytic domain-containing protein n=1 Tax=Frankia nepalensis TaxID=1836974 RepID=A0A937RKF1_9ACTN|nr:alcohol dehydrogenase catalytic domain-containing protein [Frankia nepalensis]MBL7502037.1 alcohol dehydrogenase catalytic domain-containing protein [Frankia nepalensis]MBL7511943.1 alcohol dehydrogenase catalytic domain-containing protein [Frankia nepalensis]MBL7524284.1 alcohol dehydrogenase catalytic domain-containing protein [Frankia nepalensis]MBL7630535.1 alcohol dehydrogenase catalytic domain-containing protein [Frankia nepalensis]